MSDRKVLTPAVFLATMGWSGLCPVMPGTVGTLWGLLIWYFTTRSANPAAIQAALAVAFFLLGMLVCGRAEKDLCKHDPGCVIIDETAAAFITFLGVPWSPVAALAGLFFNRLLDIWKPWPINPLQKLPGAWGIMLDDTAAGLLSRLLLAALLYFL